MKECKFCGMPLEEDALDKICDYCQNDDGREVINYDKDEVSEEKEEEY